MRENLARLIVIITGILVIVLSMLFSKINNPDKSSVVEIKQLMQGELLFQQQGCVRCHSIKDKGNKSFPLDGVANKYSDKELNDWITGAQTLEGQMSSSIMNVKSKYLELSEEELDALRQYLMLK